ncbi:MAG: DUF1634 domain-containing protein [Mucilaginibacter sp.]
MASRGKFKDTDMQLIIGWILRGGVAVSMVIVVIGGIFFISRHGHSIPDFHTFKGTPQFISTPEGVLLGVVHLRGQAIIQLGIALLIATPILRVVFAAIGFILEKDHLYTLISLIVLLVIIISMITGRIG